MPRSVPQRLQCTLSAIAASAPLHCTTQSPSCIASATSSVVKSMRPAPGQPTETQRLTKILSRRRAAGLAGGLDDSLNATVERRDADLPALQNLDGTMSGVTLAELERRRRKAAASEDYERAGQLRDLLAALKPRPQLSLEDAAPSTLAEQEAFFTEYGFVVVRHALAGERLAKVQAGWLSASSALRVEWEEAKRYGVGLHRHSFASGATVSRKFYSVPWTAPGQIGDDFVDLIDLPKVVPLVEKLVGDSETNVYGQLRHGSARCTECSARSLPPDPEAVGYTYWHRDDPNTGWWGAQPKSRTLKMFINVFAVGNNGGALAVVPKTHRLPHGPWETLGRSFRSTMTLDAELDEHQMPNYFKFASDAGDALIFDMATWHTAMANTSNEERRVAILRFSSSLVAQTPLLDSETEQRLRERGRLSKELASLVGVS